MTCVRALAALDEELRGLECRHLRRNVGRIVILVGLAATVGHDGRGWQLDRWPSVLLLLLVGVAMAVHATSRTRRFVSEGMTVAPWRPWRLSQVPGRICIASRRAQVVLPVSEVRRVEYLLYDDETERLGLTGILRLSLPTCTTVRIPDNSSSFYPLLDALQRRLSVECRDLSSAGRCHGLGSVEGHCAERAATGPMKTMKIGDIPTDRFNQLLEKLQHDGWQKTYEYDNFDAWIDHGEVVLESDGVTVRLTWDYGTGGEIEGPDETLTTLGLRP